jgi:hypothetical protein
MVDIQGRNLGADATVVSMAYQGGSTGLPPRSYHPPGGTCTIVVAGTHIRCPSQPGVGANYTFIVSVDGVSSGPSATSLSYTQPAIASVSGVGATRGPAAGNATILLLGSNFGPADNTTSLVVWAVPAANDSLAFPAVDCAVVEAHVAIWCTTGALKGASLTMRVQVEGLVNTMPQITVAGPEVRGVALHGGALVAATTGGTLLTIDGINLSNDVEHTQVTISGPAGVVDVPGCEMVVRDTRLRCVLPAGVGAITSVAVTVLGQRGALDVVGLAYAAPTLEAVSPASWTTDLPSMTMVVRGSGFGSPALAALVRVTASGASACSDAPLVTLVGSAVSVLNDTELSFVLRTTAPHVVSRWDLSLSVAGQAAVGPGAGLTVGTRPPSLPTLTFGPNGNSTHKALLLTGTDFGPVLSSCPSDVAVTIDGVPCAKLTMVQPHKQLECVTLQSRGSLVIATAAGRVGTDFDIAVLQQPPAVSTVTPAAWGTIANTTVVIRGERCARLCGV